MIQENFAQVYIKIISVTFISEHSCWDKYHAILNNVRMRGAVILWLCNIVNDNEHCSAAQSSVMQVSAEQCSAVLTDLYSDFKNHLLECRSKVQLLAFVLQRHNWTSTPVFRNTEVEPFD